MSAILPAEPASATVDLSDRQATTRMCRCCGLMMGSIRAQQLGLKFWYFPELGGVICSGVPGETTRCAPDGVLRGIPATFA